jgi:hypothetical protein
MKIAINKCYGGFGVSRAVYDALGKEWDGDGSLNNETFGIESYNYRAYRSHPDLIAAIEKVGEDEASGDFAKVQIVDIPDGVEWEIDAYDGIESIREVHRIK